MIWSYFTKPASLCFTVLCVLSLGFVSCTSAPEEEVLAEIDGLTVTVTHFENAFKEYYYRTGQVLGQDQRTKEAVLNSTFGTYVLATYAKERGLDGTDEARNKRGAIERRVLTEEYLNQVILKDISVSDEEVRNYFIRFNSQLRASHLYSRTEEGIQELHQRLQTGESFEELAKEVFQNSYLAENGGDVGRFSTDELDIAFENAAYSLNVGEISGPIRTAQGYSIIKLTERVTKPIILESEFATAKQNLRSYAFSKKEELVQREHMYSFIDQAEIDSDVNEELLDLIEFNYQEMLNKDPEFVNRLSALNKVILKFNDFTFSTDQLLEEFLISDAELIYTIQDEGSFRDFLLGVAYRTYLVENAKEVGIDDQELVQSSIEETWLNYLSLQADQYLKESIINTPAELFNFYEENYQDFYKPAEINVQRLVLKTEDDANYMLQLMELGQSFEGLIKEYTINNDDLFTNGILGFESVKTYGSLANTLMKLEDGEISKVIQYQPNEYHIYKMLGKKDARPMMFTEAQDQVNELLTRKKLREVRTQTIEEVKARHKAVVDLEKLKELTIQI